MSYEHTLPKVQPRQLRFRNHYHYYMITFSMLSVAVLAFWGWRVSTLGASITFSNHLIEIGLSAAYVLAFVFTYIFWLRSRLNQVVQVYADHLTIHRNKQVVSVQFSNIESVTIVCWSLFYFKMKSGIKHYFNSGLERVDYIWEGVRTAHPELISEEEFEKFRVSLIQYDHHQKRKEWFLKHRMMDVINWFVLPFVFLTLGYLVQSQSIVIHQHGLYFFRLFLYALLVLLSTSFIFSFILKVFVFDRRLEAQLEDRPQDKLRDMEHEETVLHRSKLFQVMTAVFIFVLIIKTDINFYSLTRLKGEVLPLNLKQGKTILVDNRFNCVGCKFTLRDGDMVVFGRGWVGQIMAKEGEVVGEILQENTGRTIASKNVQEVPKGHVAIKAANGKDIAFISISDLIGRLEN